MVDVQPSRRSLLFWWLIFISLIAIGTYFALRLGHLDISLRTSQPGFYSVARFVDGDTIDVNMNGKVETIRMIGIDTPETHRPNTPIQCYGPEAAAYTKKLIGNQPVRLQADALDTNRDRYGRLLRYIYLPDNTLVEKRLITEGYGFAYTQFPFEKALVFKTYEQDAKTAGRGLWSACQVMVEANGREQTNSASL